MVETSRINGLEDFGLLNDRHWLYIRLNRAIMSRIYMWNEMKPKPFNHHIAQIAHVSPQWIDLEKYIDAVQLLSRRTSGGDHGAL